MSNKSIILIIIALVIAVFTGFYFIYVKPYIPEYQWSENYNYNSKQPYGLKYFYKTLKESKESDDFVLMKSNFAAISHSESTQKGIYFCVGNKWNGEKDEMQDILDFVAEGNTAFFSLNEFPGSLIEKMGIEENVDYVTSYMNEVAVEEGLVSEKFPLKKYAFKHRLLKKNEPRYWAFFNEEFVTELFNIYDLNVIGRIDSSKISFVEISYQKGKIYLHTSPVLFSNFHFITDKGFEYSQDVLSFLPDQKIYWDELCKNQHSSTLNSQGEDNPLRFVLSRKSLRWAWFTLIACIIAFLLFGAKRKRKPIPLLPENKNSTFEYTKAVSALYLQSGDHTHIANEMWHLFVVFVKIKYGVVVDNSDKPAEIEILAVKSKIPLSFLKELLRLKNIVCFNWGKDSKTLFEFHDALSHFYKNCN